MYDYSQHSEYVNRRMIHGWMEHDGLVIEVQGFYYGRHDGPGPGNPYYYVPEIGVSTTSSSFHAERKDAVLQARQKLERERLRIDQLLHDLEA